jgi:hypothetical protein
VRRKLGETSSMARKKSTKPKQQQQQQQQQAGSTERALVLHQTPNTLVMLEQVRALGVAPLRQYLKTGGSPSALVELIDTQGTILHVPLISIVSALHHPHEALPECVRLLVAAGADINTVFTDGKASLRPLSSALQSTPAAAKRCNWCYNMALTSSHSLCLLDALPCTEQLRLALLPTADCCWQRAKGSCSSCKTPKSVQRCTAQLLGATSLLWSCCTVCTALM